MAGVDPEPDLAGVARRPGVGVQARSGYRVLQSVTLDAVGVGAGVELDAIGAALLRAGDLRLHRVHEEADADAPPPVAGGDLPHEAVRGRIGEVPAVVGGELRVGVRDQRRLVGARRLDEAIEARVAVVAGSGGRVALDVELDVRRLGGQQRGQRLHVGRANVALIGPRVDGDAVCARRDGDPRRVEDAGPGALPRVAEPGDLVDVDRERGHGILPPLRRLRTGTGTTAS